VQYSVKLPDLATQKDHSLFLELDIYLKNLSLAFEFQGENHFFDCQFFGECQTQIDRDVHKGFLCMKRGIRLVEVPYWWTKEAFRSTLTSVCHEL